MDSKLKEINCWVLIGERQIFEILTNVKISFEDGDGTFVQMNFFLVIGGQNPKNPITSICFYLDDSSYWHAIEEILKYFKLPDVWEKIKEHNGQ